MVLERQFTIFQQKRTNKGYAQDNWATFKVLEKDGRSLETLRNEHLME
jgi:hypothetical protein